MRQVVAVLARHVPAHALHETGVGSLVLRRRRRSASLLQLVVDVEEDVEGVHYGGLPGGRPAQINRV